MFQANANYKVLKMANQLNQIHLKSSNFLLCNAFVRLLTFSIERNIKFMRFTWKMHMNKTPFPYLSASKVTIPSLLHVNFYLATLPFLLWCVETSILVIKIKRYFTCLWVDLNSPSRSDLSCLMILLYWTRIMWRNKWKAFSAWDLSYWKNIFVNNIEKSTNCL